MTVQEHTDPLVVLTIEGVEQVTLRLSRFLSEDEEAAADEAGIRAALASDLTYTGGASTDESPWFSVRLATNASA